MMRNVRYRSIKSLRLKGSVLILRKDVIRDSARKEFDARARETNPETVSSSSHTYKAACCS